MKARLDKMRTHSHMILLTTLNKSQSDEYSVCLVLWGLVMAGYELHLYLVNEGRKKAHYIVHVAL